VQIKLTASAINDLQSLRAYIEKDQPGAAKKLAEKIVATVEEDLVLQPGMGRPGRKAGTRELVVTGTPYFIPYRVEENHLVVLRVLQGAKRWP
jgi:toxin ParE1/3/4